MPRPLRLVSDQVTMPEINLILRELLRVCNHSVPGDIVEFGCYEGTSAIFVQQLLQEKAPERRLHVYDSFAGLPGKTASDISAAGEQFKAGELRADKSALIKNFRQAGLPLPVIHQGWFDDLSASDIPTIISFAFLDGDFYESIRTSFRLLGGRLAPGATIIIDDYQNPALPGATKAVDEWLRVNNHVSIRHEQSLAIIYT